ncbi:MAG: hypothetical protein OCD76_12380 [Reichenbachiella sp.]
MSYGANDFEGKIDTGNGFGYYVIESYKILRLSAGIEYEFGRAKLRPIIGANLLFGFLLDRERNINEYYTLIRSGEDVIVGIPDEKEMKLLQMGTQASIGLKYELNDGNAVLLRAVGEYRTPMFKSMNSILDFHRINSLMIEVGYSFTLSH